MSRRSWRDGTPQFEFHYDRSDHGPDELLEAGESLLAWWTDRCQDVQEAFTAGA